MMWRCALQLRRYDGLAQLHDVFSQAAVDVALVVLERRIGRLHGAHPNSALRKRRCTIGMDSVGLLESEMEGLATT